jgi:hypothetical protein
VPYDQPTPIEKLRVAYTDSCRHIREPKSGDRFGANLQEILRTAFRDLNLSLDEQLRRTWITEAVLCSAKVEGGPVAREVGHECRKRYLDKQLALFPNAWVVLLGDKALDRLSDLLGPRVKHAFHPSARKSKEEMRASWISALREFTPTKATQCPAGVSAAQFVPDREPVQGWGLTFGAQSERRRRWNAQLCDIPQTPVQIAQATNTVEHLGDLKGHLRFWCDPKNSLRKGMRIPIIECGADGQLGKGYYKLPEYLRPSRHAV